MIRVTHIIDGLSVGGAEVMLANLLRERDASTFTAEVISLTDIGAVGTTIQELGVPVRALGLSPTLAGAPRALRLPGWVRKSRPDVVQTWLYQADLLGGIATRVAARSAPVVWGIHRSDVDEGWTKRRLGTVARLSARASRIVPKRIVCCSADAMERHVALGYDPDRMVLIPNGFDLAAFAPDEAARASVRAELGLPSDALLVGMVARLDPQKDHGSMLRAAARLSSSHPGAHVVLCGAGVDAASSAFVALSEGGTLPPNVHALGLRRDIPRIDAALDVAVLSSIGGEAFPLAVGEAMASGVPCVVTDVGDAAAMVGDTGLVVAPGDPDALAVAIASLLDRSADERGALGRAARRRVAEEYELRSVVRRYEDVYRELAHR